VTLTQEGKMASRELLGGKLPMAILFNYGDAEKPSREERPVAGAHYFINVTTAIYSHKALQTLVEVEETLGFLTPTRRDVLGPWPQAFLDRVREIEREQEAARKHNPVQRVTLSIGALEKTTWNAPDAKEDFGSAATEPVKEEGLKVWDGQKPVAFEAVLDDVLDGPKSSKR
jgi:hypothetical protein